MVSRLTRLVAPLAKLTARGGTPNALAISRHNALFASPSLGAARTRIFSTLRPSDRTSMPSIVSRPPFGVSRTLSTTPSTAADHGLSPLTLEYVRIDVPDDDVFQEQNDQDQDHRRHVDAAEIGQHRADRPPHRLRDAIQEVPHHVRHLIAGVDHVEGHQPGKHRGRDQEPNINLQNQQNDIENCAHDVRPFESGRKLPGRMVSNKPSGPFACAWSCPRTGTFFRDHVLVLILDRPYPWP